MWKILFTISVVFVLRAKGSDGHCVDVHSHIVSQGVHYIPGPNSCTVCLCEKGSPTSCKSVLCTQPTNCKSFQRGNTCCDFKCLDDILDGNTSYKDTYDLALPLFASVVFAVITLSLLFFVVHRFRRRKLHERHNRQINDDQRSLNSIGYIAGGLRYLPGNIGYLRSANNDLEFHYEETSNHLSLWKPPGNYFPRGEAPPPYEEAVRGQQIGSNARNSEVNNTVENNQNQHIQCTTQIVPEQQSTLINGHQSTVVSIRGESSNNDSLNRNEIAHITNTLNRSDEYQNIKVQDQQELVPLVEQVKAEVNITNRPSKLVQNSVHLEKKLHHPRPERSKKCIATCEKIKYYENFESNRLIGKSQTTETKHENNGGKPHTSSAFHNFRLDKNNLEKVNEYHQDVMLTTLSHAIIKDKASSKTLERLNKLTQKCIEENRYENIGVSLQKQKHRSIPAPIEFQNEKNNEKIHMCKDIYLNGHKKEKIAINANATTSRGSEPKRAKEQIFLIDSKAAPFFLKDLKKSLEDCRDSSCSLLRDPNDVPVFTVCRSREMVQDDKKFSLHRTLPKNLKELVTDSPNSELGFNYSSFKKSGNYVLHRSLPKHLNDCDVNPSGDRTDTSVSIKDDSIKECPLLEPVNLRFANSSTTPTSNSNKQSIIDIKRREEQTLGSYQCLFFPQDDDDYRSECENCKTVDSAGDDEENDGFNETMTLQRRPLETVDELPYYRTSLTLPTQIKKPRPTLQNPNRENWFRGMQETSSSDESE